MSAIYDKLRLTGHEIRLLRIRKTPGREERLPLTIDCSLVRYTLGDKVILQYIALSYMWGPKLSADESANLPDVYVNGELFSATANLHLALMFLSRRARDVPLWIDDISINQMDQVEKGHQVSLMRRIYTDAILVWAWQSPTQTCNLAMDFLVEAWRHSVESMHNKSWPSVCTTWLSSQLVDTGMRRTWDSLASYLDQPTNYTHEQYHNVL
jgi:hypothetical protein